MNKNHGLNSGERVPFGLFHAAVEREKESAAKQHHVEMLREGQITIFEAVPQTKKEENLKMIEQVLAKIKNEMANSKNNAYVQVIGEYLINYVQNNPSSAEKVMDEKKTIVGSLDAMRKEAEKKKQNNCAVLTDQEGFAIVLKYMGLDAETAIIQQPVQASVPITIKTNDTPQTVDNIPKTKPRFKASFEEFL
ncbi:Cas9 inhibitor AcrIIA9 family protein [Solibacillus sp. FSL K6-1523]|uniref:Cas9 inhibitor AcrIIA9 family protein n=1 Tax=Solibacillus sp. FSL K6-1523 TaxID=2921471 RepID=UPI0030FC48DD